MCVQRFAVAEGVGFEDEFDFVANASECVDFGFAFALSVWRIFEAPVVAVDHARKGWADLVGVPTYGDHCGDALIEILIKVIGAVTFGADPEFLDRLKCEWVHFAFWFGASAVDIEEVASGSA